MIEEKREKHDAEHQKELAERYAKSLTNYLKKIKSSFKKKKEEEIHHEGPSLAIILKGMVTKIITLFIFYFCESSKIIILYFDNLYLNIDYFLNNFVFMKGNYTLFEFFLSSGFMTQTISE